ncbi:MAG: PIG-L family deacetylase [Ornithinimicrobium sp.]
MNAHPDDEAILMGGTVAAMSDAGHRVVLVTATDGDAGEASASYAAGGLGARRLRELQASAFALGAERVVDLGYGDSGMGPAALACTTGRPRLHTVGIEEGADRVAQILTDQHADVVLGCDAAGGYGHRDHVHLHHIVRRAVHLARRDRPTRLFEATAPREPILAALRLLHRVHRVGDFDPEEWAGAFTPSALITHRMDVHDQIHAKRAALNAHASQHSSGAGTGTGTRTMARALRAPIPVLRSILGREYFVEPGRAAPPVAGAEALADMIVDAA